MKEISSKLKKQIMGLKYEEIVSQHSFCYDLLVYGIEALGNFYVMKEAERFIEAKKPAKELFKKFSIIRPRGFGHDKGKFSFRTDKIADDGIFIPLHFLPKKHRISLFDRDYYHRTSLDSWISKKDDAILLLEHYWITQDFENLSLVEKGIQFGRDMLNVSVREFNKNKGRDSGKFNNLGEGLIEYYSSFLAKFH